jgi:hypothetical protein
VAKKIALDKKLGLKATLFLSGKGRHDEATIQGELIGILSGFIVFRSRAGTTYVIWPGSVSHVIIDEQIEFAEPQTD